MQQKLDNQANFIRSHVLEHKLKHWLAFNDSVYEAYELTTDLLPLEPRLVLLDSTQGIGVVRRGAAAHHS